jgi:hypothetical protein
MPGVRGVSVSKRRVAIQAGTVLAVLGGLVTLGIQVDSYIIQRRQLVAQMRFEDQVRDCETTGGRWWRGNCEPIS